MKNNLQFDFLVDKETNTVTVTREFDAPQSDVWAAWTEPEILDRWWAPHPFRSKTKSMEFREGGRRLYAMLGPNGEEHWGFADFISITPITNFKQKSGFCDEQGNQNHALPQSTWNVDFSESGDTTTVQVNILHESLDDLEMIIQMGFKEGFTITLNKLAEMIGRKES